PQISCSVPMLPPNVDDVIRDPFCEPGEDLVNEQNTTTATTTTGTDKCLTGLPTTIPSSLYSNYDSHLELPHHQSYFSPAVSSVVTTTTNSFYPLNLKWILSE